MMSSTYDQIHDQYWHISTPKAGTRYERLAAFVIKSLNVDKRVVHDIKLVGDSDVKHQIDITIDDGRGKKRILIECKDFDISSKKVGLSIIRDFSAVIDDTKPDEAIIITCNGFTKEAKKFAKHKGIKLAVLREFQPSDWKGRMKKIRVTIHIMDITEPRVSLMLPDQVHINKFQNDMAKAGMEDIKISEDQPVYLNLKDQRIQINDFIKQKSDEKPRNTPGPVQLKIPLTGSSIEIDSFGNIPIDGMIIDYEVMDSDEYFEVASNKIARLILSGFNGRDMVIFEDNLKCLFINNETGEVYV
ncbi:MAG: restriction endonuclease [Methylobacter sp.]